MKRELRLMRNMMIKLTSLLIAGTPYLVLILWPILFKTPPPEALYLISVNSLTIACQCKVIVTILITTDVRKCLFDYLKKFYRFVRTINISI